MRDPIITAESNLLPPRPLAFILLSAVAGVFMTIIIGIFAVPVLWTFKTAGTELTFTLAVVCLIGYGALISQDVINNRVDTDGAETSGWGQTVVLLFGFVYYNLALFAGTFAAYLSVYVTGVVEVGFVVALVYAVYENYTIERLIPLSVGGLIVWTLALAYGLKEAGIALRDAIKEARSADENSVFRVMANQLEISIEYPAGLLNLRRFRPS